MHGRHVRSKGWNFPLVTSNTFDSLVSLYQKQMSDFLKIWIHTDGPERIIAWARQRIESILKNQYTKVVESVMHRYLATQAVTRLLAHTL